MHNIFSERNGWEAEILRDDTDLDKILAVEQRDLTLTEEQRALKGCSHLKHVKRNDTYVAELRYEEIRRNQEIRVEGLVFRRNGNPIGENGLEDVKYFKRNTFYGEYCKTRAAAYDRELKAEIDQNFFGNA